MYCKQRVRYGNKQDRFVELACNSKVDPTL